MKQDNSNEILNDVTTNDYKYGFVTDIETDIIPYPPYFGEEKGAGMVT